MFSGKLLLFQDGVEYEFTLHDAIDQLPRILEAASNNRTVELTEMAEEVHEVTKARHRESIRNVEKRLKPA